MKDMQDTLRDREDRLRRYNICLIRMPKGNNRKNEGETIFKEIMAVIFQELTILILIFM